MIIQPLVIKDNTVRTFTSDFHVLVYFTFFFNMCLYSPQRNNPSDFSLGCFGRSCCSSIRWVTECCCCGFKRGFPPPVIFSGNDVILSRFPHRIAGHIEKKRQLLGWAASPSLAALRLTAHWSAVKRKSWKWLLSWVMAASIQPQSHWQKQSISCD